MASALLKARWSAALALLLLLAPAPTVRAQSDRDHELDVESFDLVWKRIKEKYWDPELGGVDWDGTYERLRPKVEAAQSRDEVRDAMRELIGTLGKSHFGILAGTTADLVKEASKNPNEVESDEASEAPKSSVRGGPGISGLTIRVLGGAALVTAVRAGTPAEASGIRPGWELLAVDGRSVPERIERIQRDLHESSMLELILSRSVEAMLNRSAGTELELTLRDGEDEEVKREVATIARPGKLEKFGNLPAMYVEVDSRRLDSGVGYLFVSDWFGLAVITGFRKAASDFQDAPGLIIDLRGNPGGVGGMAIGAAGFLIDQPLQNLGKMITRDSPGVKFSINPRQPCFTGPVAILVDGSSASTSEIFSGGLQDLGRARIFGSTSAGAALPSVVEKLPNGDSFQYAIANFVSTNGHELEGVGVVPDEVVVPTRETLLEEGDPVLKAAQRWILDQHDSK